MSVEELLLKGLEIRGCLDNPTDAKESTNCSKISGGC